MESKFIHTIKSCWLCTRFPFLYPRNRFTDKHQVNVLERLIWKLKENSLQLISITGKQETENASKYYHSYGSFLNYHYELKKDDKKLYIWRTGDKVKKVHDLTSILWNSDKFEILGTNLIFAFAGNPIIQIMVKTKDETDKSNYGFNMKSVEFVTDKWTHFWYKVLSWFDEKVLDRILFIPTYTELDAMPTGWRKAFGVQLCKEIRSQLIKENFLFQYRITQIKEKFGGLRWYDEVSSREIQDIIQKYEEISYKTCIVCGKPATKISGGWIRPYCDEHFPKNGTIYKTITE